MIEVKCPNCGCIAPDPNDMYEEPEIFNRFWRDWFYTCPNCGKHYQYSRIYSCISEETVLIGEDEDETDED